MTVLTFSRGQTVWVDFHADFDDGRFSQKTFLGSMKLEIDNQMPDIICCQKKLFIRRGVTSVNGREIYVKATYVVDPRDGYAVTPIFDDDRIIPGKSRTGASTR